MPSPSFADTLLCPVTTCASFSPPMLLVADLVGTFPQSFHLGTRLAVFRPLPAFAVFLPSHLGLYTQRVHVCLIFQRAEVARKVSAPDKVSKCTHGQLLACANG
eukprot:RCo024744